MKKIFPFLFFVLFLLDLVSGASFINSTAAVNPSETNAVYQMPTDGFNFDNMTINGTCMVIGGGAYEGTYCLNYTVVTNISMLDFFRTLILIDEKTNEDFNVSNVSSAIAYYDVERILFDFQANGSNQFNFSSVDKSDVRVELGYSDGSYITRYISANLTDQEIRVCANKEGITHYEQLIIAANVKPAILNNLFADCLVAADYTRFAYQDAFLLKAYTTNGLYYLYTYDSDGNVIYLASVDGTVETYINLETLEFQSAAYNLNILGDTISFQTTDNTTMRIYYRNLDEDNLETIIRIKRMDTNVYVFNTTETTAPNNITLYFNHATLTNVTNTTLFLIEVVKVTEEGEETINQYFNFLAKSGYLRSGVAVAISFLLTVFGLSFAISRITFSWFGILMVIASIAVLSFAVGAWYVTFFMVLNVIIMVYIFIQMVQQNYPTVS